MELFTGLAIAIGGTAVGGLILYFGFGIGKPKKQRPITTTTVDASPGDAAPPSSVTFAEIQEYLASLPPFQAEQATEHYRGIQVRWSVLLHSSFTVEGAHYIVTRTPEEMFARIVCPVDIDRYPQLKVAPKDTQLTIQATIDSVAPNRVRLENCRLFFD